MVDWKADSAVQITQTSSGGSGASAYAKIAGWNISRDVNKMVTSWHIDFAEAIEVDDDARFTILRGIGSGGVNTSIHPLWNTQGYGATLIQNARATEWDVSADNENLAWGCSGKTGEIDYVMTGSATSPPKDIYFVNPNFLNSISGGYRNWRLVNGILCWTTSSGRNDASQWPIEHEDLPGRGVDPDTYQIILQYTKHHQIAAYLASLMGYLIEIGTPDLELRRVMHFSSSESYVDMINKIFSLWNADIRFDESSQDEPTLWVMDTAGPDNPTTQPKCISVQARAIKSLGCKNVGKDKNPVDHVKILGAKDWNTWNLPEPGELKSIQLYPIDQDFPEEDIFEFWYQSGWSASQANKVMGDYTGGWNDADAPDQKRPQYVIHTERYYVPRDKDGLYILMEMDETFDDEGPLHTHRVHYRYGPGIKLIYTSEYEYARVQKPGEPFKSFELVRHTSNNQSLMIDGLNRACGNELTEEPIVYTEVWDAAAQKYVKCAPVSLVQSQQQGRTSKNPAANQKILEMTTKIRTMRVARASRGVLAQVTKEYDTLTETNKVHAQFLRDPRSKTDEEKNRYQKEFYLPGQTVYHRTVTVEHPDICSDAIAQAIVDRIFAKSAANIERQELTLELVMPIQMPDTGFTIRLPEMYAVSDRGANSRITKRLIQGGEYNVSQVSESCSAGESDMNYSQQFTLRNYLG